MLTYVTKSRYWEIIDSGIMVGVPGTKKWHLKDVQDAVVYSYLYEKSGLQIAEVGAGDSRLLRVLSQTNQCYAIDEYKGAGNGPKRRPDLDNVTFIECSVGNSGGVIDDESFDIIFSVSVVEHIPHNALPGFFEDCRRILKPGGLMVHLIDAYVESEDGDNAYLWARLNQYKKPFMEGAFRPVGSVRFQTQKDVAFNTSLATNPDDVMREWNRSSPALIEKRKVAQSCAIEMAGYRAR